MFLQNSEAASNLRNDIRLLRHRACIANEQNGFFNIGLIESWKKYFICLTFCVGGEHSDDEGGFYDEPVINGNDEGDFNEVENSSSVSSTSRLKLKFMHALLSLQFNCICTGCP